MAWRVIARFRVTFKRFSKVRVRSYHGIVAIFLLKLNFYGGLYIFKLNA